MIQRSINPCIASRKFSRCIRIMPDTTVNPSICCHDSIGIEVISFIFNRCRTITFHDASISKIVPVSVNILPCTLEDFSITHIAHWTTIYYIIKTIYTLNYITIFINRICITAVTITKERLVYYHYRIHFICMATVI